MTTTKTSRGSYPGQWLSGNQDYSLTKPFFHYVQADAKNLCVSEVTTIQGEISFTVKGLPAVGSATYVLDPAKCTATVREVENDNLSRYKVVPASGGVVATACPSWIGQRTARGVKVEFSFTYGKDDSVFEGTATTNDVFQLEMCGKWMFTMTGTSSYPRICMEDVVVTDLANTCTLSQFEIHSRNDESLNICSSGAEVPCPPGINCAALCQGVVGELCSLAQTLGQGLDNDAFGDEPICLDGPTTSSS